MLHGGCETRKPRHPTESEARKAALIASKRARVRLSYYRCEKCAGYHLTRSVGGANP